jgi:HJR/Mrr/RecB family endonuclease
VLSHLGWHDIQIIGEAGDCGGDTLGVDRNGKTWVIQAKSVTGDRLVGPKALQEALNAAYVYGADALAVATNGISKVLHSRPNGTSQGFHWEFV